MGRRRASPAAARTFDRRIAFAKTCKALLRGGPLVIREVEARPQIEIGAPAPRQVSVAPMPHALGQTAAIAIGGEHRDGAAGTCL